jgi:peptidyl-dipeptidase A
VPYTGIFSPTSSSFNFTGLWPSLPDARDRLNRCSIYQSKEAGRRLDAMLSLGLSKPWPDALEAITGQRQMDATAVLDYFAPLQKWLDEQNKGKPVGW